MKSIKILFLAAIAATMLSGCSDDQTSFDIKKVPGSAVVKGNIVYNQGVDLVDGKFTYVNTPAANVTVLFEVDNSDYDDDLSGTTVLTTKTDKDGNYSIKIPATTNGSIDVNISVPNFAGIFKYVDTKDGKTEIFERNVVYKGEDNISISNHDIKFCNFKCTIAEEEEEGFKDYTEMATLKGTIGKNAEYYVPAKLVNGEYQDAQLYYVWEPAASVDLIVYIDYPGEENVSYYATTNNNGEFTLQVPVVGFPTNFYYTVEAVEKEGTFTHYEPVVKVYTDKNGGESTFHDYEKTTLKGIYQTINTNNSGYAYYNTPTDVKKIIAKAMVFRPSEPNESTYRPNLFSTSNQWLEELLESLSY